MRKNRLWYLLALLGGLSDTHPVVAMSIINGAFDDGLSAWHGMTTQGQASYDRVSGKAFLSSGPGTASISAALLQGDDGSFQFGDAQRLNPGDDILSFDADFSWLTTDIQEVSGSFPDVFQVMLYDADDPGGASDIRLLSRAIGDVLGERHFSFNIADRVDHVMALSFELSDENDGQDYRVSIDNVRIETLTHSVPEPAIPCLLVLGVVLLCHHHSRWMMPA